ncbi:slipin family protein [Mesorhizobium sangaii]|uniref:Regulator of protease activity HflC (Stomatin/prohibitin superfamily) n=1 Tax=Mesorhizobium sangaii TaxID=505389 RepID=A0A841P643_9HYPH|nr:slipin family protein [Mesorhizobium sangaii]MBB6410646.1 regulator of protease activity HflC (stomatin/prohibitin superfamily) [Mesorhizobium sangaii]
MTILDKVLGRERVLVRENERALTLYKGEIKAVLLPGEHWLANRRGSLEVSRHDLKNPEFVSAYEKALFDKLPDVATRHFTVVRTGRTEVAVIERDGNLHAVLAPDRKLVLWTDAGPWKVTLIDTSADLAIDAAVMRRLGQARKAELMSVHPVVDGQAGLLFIDGVLVRTLAAGVHAFWNVGRMVQIKVVDLKRQSLDVAGQEVLTKDRVTIRVNIAAEYRVVDPVKAVSAVKDFSEALYRALQYAFRKTLGALTLDQILEKKVTVDEEAAAKVRADMAEIGVEVSDIALKDVILPGEMREILNQVVSAEKQAEANIIRRREETNATRSLLNTAKVMAENPVMLRLKELEALETIAGKVERLTVHNGTGGLLNDLVKLRDS